MSDRRTKAELLARIEELSEQINNPRETYVEPVPEATAVAACVRALDKMLNGARRTSGYSSPIYTDFGNGPIYRQQTEVERVLRLLAAKYQVPLIDIEVQRVECNRPHVTVQAIQEAVARAVQP